MAKETSDELVLPACLPGWLTTSFSVHNSTGSSRKWAVDDGDHRRAERTDGRKKSYYSSDKDVSAQARRVHVIHVQSTESAS